MTIYVNWENHEVLTDEQYYEKIEEYVDNYYDSVLFKEWINDHYDASDVFKANTSDIINDWKDYVEEIYAEEYEEIELDE